MKTLVVPTFALACIGGFFTSGTHAVLGADVTKMPFETAQEAFSQVGQGRDAFDFVEQSLAAKRTDLVRLCWQNQYTAYYLRGALKALPDSKFKSEALVAILRSPSSQWDIGKGILWLSTYYDDLANDLIPMVRTYLPDTPISFDVIKTAKQREQLAADIEAAVAAKKGN